MPINESHEDLPMSNGLAPLPSDHSMIARPAADAWWTEYQASPDFRRARAIEELPLRASAVALRCDRAFWYSLAGVEVSDPTDAAGVFRMRLGTLVHSEIDKFITGGHAGRIDDQGRKQGWFTEEAIDLRPAGFPGSAHGDLVFYMNDTPLEVGEIKTVGGYGFKLMTSNFNGPPEGPKWEHMMQAAMVAVAIGAQHVRLVYFSMESLSPSVAKSCGADQYGRFSAEWVYDLDEAFPGTTKTIREAVAAEAKRQVRILNLAQPGWDGFVEDGTLKTPIMPERTLSHPSYPGGSMVTNPSPPKGQAPWVKLNMEGSVVKTGTTWMCEYCDFKKQCIEDGPESRECKPVELIGAGSLEEIAP